MTGQFALHHIATYNPRLLNAEELRRYFVARQDLLDRLLDNIRNEGDAPPQHHLLIGQRGMGKTTLLCRLAQAIADDAALNAEWLPLLFPEEQWNVARLSDFWLNCLDALGDALEKQGREDEAAKLDAEVEGLVGEKDEDRLARATQELLLAWAHRLQRRLVLLVDNVDRAFETLKEAEQWAVRSALQAESSLLLVGASSAPLETTFRYNKPFYDLFKVHDMKRLTLDELREVLLHLAQSLHAPQVAKLVQRDPGRIRVFYDFTGGNPRNIVLLFAALAQGAESDLRAQLERLLDQCTPLYKARIDELPVQQQQVVDALMMAWHPASAADIAAATRMDVNAVSGQLSRLADSGLVEKVPLPRKKRTGFMISERFFNIWYLMRRATRRTRLRPLWLAEFLKGFYGNEELRKLAEGFLTGGEEGSSDGNRRRGEFGFLLAQALEDQTLKRAVEHRAASELLAIRDQLGDLLADLQECEPHAVDMDDVRRMLREVPDSAWPEGIDRGEFERKFIGALLISSGTKRMFANAIQIDPQKMVPLAWAYIEVETEILEKKLPRNILEAMRSASMSGLLHHLGDLDGLRALARESGMPDLEMQVRTFFGTESKEDAAHWCSVAAWGGVFVKLDRDVAEQCYLSALRCEPEYPEALTGMGVLLFHDKNRLKDALEYMRRATRLPSATASSWLALGQALLSRKHDSKRGMQAVQRAFEIEPHNAEVRLQLALDAMRGMRIKEAYELLEEVAVAGDRRAIVSLTAVALNDEKKENVAWSLWKKFGAGQRQKYALPAAFSALTTKKWSNVEPFLRQALILEEGGLFEGNLFSAMLMQFVALASERGLLPELIHFLEAEGLDERWLPLYEALKAHLDQSNDSLLGVAPEVRTAAQSILDFLNLAVDSAKAPPQASAKTSTPHRKRS